MKDWQISGPEFLDGDYYALEAVMPAAAQREEARLMLQSLLKERFQLRFHMEQKVVPVYMLAIDKSGLKMKPVQSEPGSTRYGRERGRFFGSAVSLASLADTLNGMSDRPVIDGTGLQGIFDFDWTWSPDPDQHSGGTKILDPGMIAAMRTQAGLRLETRRISQEILVIDHLEKTPSQN